ncbi:MAG: DUF4270 family protein, partial [Saprospiraceae bacterium]|nr:DUF4270 family protein [Saprospiraceae bacterium]
AGILLAAIALWTGCKKPGALGYELVDDEYSDYAFTDTIQIRCTIERDDSTLTSDVSSTADYFLCGELNDPEFGKSTSEIYALLLGQNLNPNFDTTQAFDSIVLYLNYAPAGFYGDTLQPQTLRVFRVDAGSELKDDQDYYSNHFFPASTEIGKLENFYPKPTTSDSLFEGIEGAFLKLTLDPAFGLELFTLDSSLYSVDSTFQKILRGLKITSSSAGSGAMMAFNLNNSSLSRIRLFYHQKSDSAALNYDFFFEGANKFTHFIHDHSGSPAGQLLGQTADDKLYVQGMEGVRVKIEFPYAQLLNNIAVNQAQLVLNVADDNLSFAPAAQTVLTQWLESDTNFVYTSDVFYSLGPNLTGGFGSFGGDPNKVVINGSTVTQYRLTLSELFQHMVDDDNSTGTKNRTVYLNVFPRSRTAERAVFFGPKSASFPAKLELTYTLVK